MPELAKITTAADPLRAEFHTNGFAIVPGLANPERVARLLAVVKRELAEGRGPAEYESDLHYPGAPASRSAPGGDTIRRLLDAWSRSEEIRSWATDAALVSCLRRLMGLNLVMSRAHHNCIMTKQPRHSSATGWHQDLRYWSFERPELVSVWLALASESPENGGLWLIPGSHRMTFSDDRFDDRKFFRPDLAANDSIIQTRVTAQLNPGDALFFHCLTLHSAGNNRTNATKHSLVFSYRAADNLPLADTRSSSLPEIAL